MEKEKWKEVPGFEQYKVSNFGRLMSTKEDGSFLIRSLKRNGNVYISVVLNNRYTNKNKSYKMHRLVAMLFVDNPENKPQVNHKDLDKKNNHYLNLEWVTARENIMHSVENNPNMIKGMVNYNTMVRPRKIIQKDKKGNVLNIFNNSTEAYKSTGVCARNILQVASKDEFKPGRTRKQAGGFIWEYES